MDPNTLSIFLDIVVLLVVGGYAVSGARRGFVMTVSGLVSILLAYIGAGLLARLFAPAVAGLIEPYLQRIELPAILSAETLEHYEYAGIKVSALEPVRQSMNASASQLAARIISGIAAKLAYALVAVVAFLVLCLVFHGIFRAMDLVTRLPVLSFLNGTLGFVAGLAVGCLLMVVLAWVAGFFDAYVTPEAVSLTRIYRFFADPPALLTLFR